MTAQLGPLGEKRIVRVNMQLAVAMTLRPAEELNIDVQLDLVLVHRYFFPVSVCYGEDVLFYLFPGLLLKS